MNKKFITVSISIFLFSLIFILGFKFILGDKLLYTDSTEEAFNSDEPIIKYSGFEEDENIYKIKVNIKNNSKYYASLYDLNLKFSYNTEDNIIFSSDNATPVFRGSDNKEREYILNFKEGDKYNFSSYLDPNEEREYIFEISKGLKFDKEVFDTNRMSISYGVNYFKYKIKSNTVIIGVGSIGASERIDNSTEPYIIEW